MLEVDFGGGGWKRPPAPALLSQKPWKSRLSRRLMFDAAPPPGRVRLLLASDGAAAFRAVFLPVATGCKGLSAPVAESVCAAGKYRRRVPCRRAEPPAGSTCTAANRKSSARTRSLRHRPTADSCHRRSWRTAAGSAGCSVPFGRASGA